MRGMLTDEIQNIAVKLLDEPITQVELRLMPYIHYLAVNEEPVDPRKINSEEDGIILSWRMKNLITEVDETKPIKVTKRFWDIMNELIFIAYVDHER